MSVSLYGSGQTVLQVVSANFSTQTSTTSTTPVATPITLSITPQSTTSKILVQVVGATYMNTGSQVLYTQIYRGSTGLGTFLTPCYFTSGVVSGTCPMTFLDSPATTSPTTYNLYFWVSGGTGYINVTNSQATITLLEISGS